MPSSSIRPITTRLPASKALWDDTNLPLCVVVTPTPKQDKPHPTASTIKPFSAIPKCLHCGAPHPTKATHYRPLQHSVLFCYLCGETSSTVLRDQQDVRKEEILDPETYDSDSVVIDKDGNGNDNDNTDQIFQVPLFSDSGSTLSAPAVAVPPVWWIVLDASQTKRSYWNAVSSALEKALAEIPPHVHVGMLAANATHVSSWDLTSAVPHVWQYPYDSSKLDLCLVPADALHASCLQSALRAVADAPVAPADTESTGMALGLTMELILEYMEQAQHPGDVNFQEDDDNEDVTPLTYAGGKILCLLGNTPLDLEPKSDLVESQPHYFQGGVAGACSAPDKWEGSDVPAKEPTDMTPKNLKTMVKPLVPEDLFDTIGTKCANAALGVDLIVVVPEEEEDEDLARLAMRPWYGLPLLRVLADTSGAPGPLMFSSLDVESLEQQVLARAPWQPGMTFGAELRLRISPGFEVESSPVDKIGRAKLQLAPSLSTGGLAGPAVCIEPETWIMGTCDEHMSLTVDFVVEKEIQEQYPVDGFGDVTLKPVIQTCFAYTCIEEDENGKFQTVRKVKVSNVSMPLTEDAEPIFDALDTEALATVLFHKLCLSAMQDGFAAAQTTAELWLQALLICVYQSAQVEQANIEEMMDQQGMADGMETSSVNRERLLDLEGGDLEEEDVLMGMGHAKIANLPLTIYGLLQCDALRPTCGSYRPSMDARCAAMAQMASMTPTALVKCIAPSLQFWSTRDDEPIMESMDLNNTTIREAIREMKEDAGVFFLDSPQQIILYRSDRLFSSTKSETAKPGPKLKAAVQAASRAYRTMPTVRFELKNAESNEAKEEASLYFDTLLLEDKATASGKQDFAEWKAEMATKLHAALKKSGDIN